MKLQEIAEIRTGLVLSRKQTKEPTPYTYKVFTLSSIEKEGTIRKGAIEDFQSKTELENKLLTQEGDILIRLSTPYTAVYIDKKLQNILVPSLVAIIRVKSEVYLPEYVKVYLNSQNAKKQIRQEANGTVIATVTTKALKELEIPQIDKEKQENIIAYTNTYLEEKKKAEELMLLKEKEYQYRIAQSIRKEIIID